MPSSSSMAAPNLTHLRRPLVARFSLSCATRIEIAFCTTATLSSQQWCCKQPLPSPIPPGFPGVNNKPAAVSPGDHPTSSTQITTIRRRPVRRLATPSLLAALHHARSA